MPHKRNPIVSERICGLARLLRANLHPALENIALWHERDISHSSAERVILPDSTIALDYMLHLATRLVDGLQVFPERMRANLERTGGATFSQAVLLALVDRGLSRDDAYRAVQRAARAVWDEEASFAEALERELEGLAPIDRQDLDALLDPTPFIRHLDGIFARLEKLEVKEAAPSPAVSPDE
jgi:adenylosuccinate lyase